MSKSIGSFLNLLKDLFDSRINWFLSESTNKESDLKLINSFRKKMNDGNPTVYKLSNGNLVKE